MSSLKIMAIGDVVGNVGRNLLLDKLQGLKELNRVDIVIVNGENAADGRSITPKMVQEMLANGVDVITMGNHVWDKDDILGIIDNEPKLIRPANYPVGVAGKGVYTFKFKGQSISVINLMGRVHMDPIDCPFMKFDEMYKDIDSDIIIVDFHAEATSEKRAFGWYLDGRASAVFGTHTHVQTADEEIFPGGTGYITDIGMTGAFDSVIGMKKEGSIHKLIYKTKVRFEPATGNPKINGIILTIDSNGKTEEIKRLYV